MPFAKPSSDSQSREISEFPAPNLPNRSKTELEKRDILRMSNEESNRLTKECLQTALIHLMSEKPFEQITITELVKRSGVSRTAFYRNYASKEMILTELSNAFFNELTKSLAIVHTKDDLYQWYLGAFKTVRLHGATFRILMQSHLPKRELIGTELILERVRPSMSPEEHYRLVALENGFAAILANWFNSGMKESEEFLAQFCVNTLPMW